MKYLALQHGAGGWPAAKVLELLNECETQLRVMHGGESWYDAWPRLPPSTAFITDAEAAQQAAPCARGRPPAHLDFAQALQQQNQAKQLAEYENLLAKYNDEKDLFVEQCAPHAAPCPCTCPPRALV